MDATVLPLCTINPRTTATEVDALFARMHVPAAPEDGRCAAEHITHADHDLLLLVGVDTQVFHGFLRCGAVGAITGVGNCLPTEVLHLIGLCRRAVAGDADATRLARELDDALHVLSTFDEGPDLVLYYKYLATLLGDAAYAHPVHHSDTLSPSQRAFAAAQVRQFKAWWSSWPGQRYGVGATGA